MANQILFIRDVDREWERASKFKYLKVVCDKCATIEHTHDAINQPCQFCIGGVMRRRIN